MKQLSRLQMKTILGGGNAPGGGGMSSCGVKCVADGLIHNADCGVYQCVTTLTFKVECSDSTGKVIETKDPCAGI